MDRILKRRLRRHITKFLGVIVALLALVILGNVLFDSVLSHTFDTSSITGRARYYVSAFLILFGPYAVLAQLSLFYNTLYYRGLDAILREDLVDTEGITQEVAAVCVKGEGDLTRGFLMSSYGEEILLRSGIGKDSVDTFLASSRTLIRSESLQLKPHAFLTLQDIGEFLIVKDSTFKAFLFSHSVTEDLFLGANEWVSRVRLQYKARQRWWSRDNLGKITGIGREFSFGIAYELKQYIRDIESMSRFGSSLGDLAYANEVIARVETTLARAKAANVIMVGEPGVGKMDMLIELGKRMEGGRSVESLTGKRLVVFDTDAFVATHTTKEAFEYTFMKLMGGIERAGNIIVVIDNLPAFMRSVEGVGTNVSELLGRFLTSPDVQLVTTTDPGSYHQTLENNHQLLQHFEPILIEKPDLSSTVRVLEGVVRQYEYQHNIFLSYPALVRIAAAADRYIVEGVMPDKAVNLLAEIASHAEQEQQGFIDGQYVDHCVSGKTGIPIGAVTGEERDTLMHLDTILHERVVGQDDAIQAITSTMRRARAGIQSSDKPMGSFLFLGSTGVGKTETAKALAHVFFGNEESMVRFDMTEYSDVNGLERLLGTTTTAGALASKLKEHPYGVLLLDEFEKSAVPVRDLFLQILDEGVFTDARGQHINARNTIIIATSNAGSDLVWKLVQEGKRPSDHKDAIIGSIIERNIFKPELVNRFDAAIIFETLGEEHQQKIAALMLGELKERIKERGYELVVNNVLIEALMKKGYSPEFGARPMRRAVQDIIEEKVALKIIEGGLSIGDTIEFGPEDFTL